MAGEIKRVDELFTLNGTGYGFMFPEGGATLGFSSANPFPPKLVSGDRNYSQYDIFSFYAMGDLSGGMGQDRAVDVTRYYTAYNLDARSGRLVLGPLVHTNTADPSSRSGAMLSVDTAAAPSPTWFEVGGDTAKRAAKFTTTDARALDHVWLPLKASVATGTVTAKIYSDSAGVPDTELASTTIARGELRTGGQWSQASFATQLSLSAATTYWVSVEHTGTGLYWYGQSPVTSTDSSAYYDSSWNAATTVHLSNWMADPTVKPDSPIRYVVGSGEDGIPRVWGYAGRYVYYFGADSVAVPLGRGSGLPQSVYIDQDPAGYLLLSETFDDNNSTYANPGIGVGERLLVCCATPSIRIEFTLGATANGAVSTAIVKVWDGAAWSAVDNLVDNTAVDGKTLAQSGSMAHDAPAAWAISTIEGVAGYWYEITFSAPLDSAPHLAEIHAVDENLVRMSADITDALFFVGTADANAWLYLALGDSVDMSKVDCSVGTEQFRTLATFKARKLCVHDSMLWRAYDTNQVDGSLVGNATYGNPVSVGDKTYGVRNMISWNGGLYVGKDDGLYLVSYPTGYPTSDVPTCQKIIDFAAHTDGNNFSMMVEHQGDLYFNLMQSLMRYTSGGVVAAITPDTGLNLAASDHCVYRAGVSTLAALWVVAEGTLTGASSLLTYIEGKWHPIVTAPRVGDMMRGICVDPGWYGDSPRVWFGEGLQVAYVQMPTATQRRYDAQDMDYASSGYILTSWMDGNIRTIDKDWVEVQIDTRDVEVDVTSILVEWRPDEDTAWETVGGVYETGITKLAMPANSYSSKAQLKLSFYAFGSTNTPQVEAIVLRYIERPDDLQAFTRTYEMSDHKTWRNGQEAFVTLAEQVTELQLLRSSKEPLAWRSWWGTTYNVHIMDYNCSETIEEKADQGDKGHIMVMMRLQRV